MIQAKLLNILNKVNILYEEYMKTHDFFLSKWMYLRFLFPALKQIRPIDYAILLNNLDIILKHLKTCLSELEFNSDKLVTEDPQDFNAIYNYTYSLFDAMWVLREIQYKLHLNSQSKAPYSLLDYKYDKLLYKNAVKRYYEIGESYNKELDKNA